MMIQTLEVQLIPLRAAPNDEAIVLLKKTFINYDW